MRLSSSRAEDVNRTRTPPSSDVPGHPRNVDRFAADCLKEPTSDHLDRLWAQHERLILELEKLDRFALGLLAQTSGAQETMADDFHVPGGFLLRHKQGDWGEMDAEDIQANDEAVHSGSRIVSAYRIRKEQKVWVITEYDRSVTTLLLLDEC